MPCYAKNIIHVAKSQIGYLEKASNKDLDDFTANAGKNNFTKYARDFNEFAHINNQGSPWCDMFVDWCFTKAFGIENAKRLLNGFSAYTPTSAQYFKTKKQWFVKPQVGDVIFFKNDIRICHTGIVYKVTDSKVYTIEGNTSNGAEVIENGGAVCEKSYLLSNCRIAGYGRPKYDVVKVVVKPTIYVVKQGDTLSTISLKKLGKANRYQEIMKLNGLETTVLHIGQELKLPPK